MTKRSPLTKEQLEICPYGSENCPICRLDPEEIKYIHKLKLEKDLPYKDIRERMKHLYKMSPNLNTFTDHFNKHIKEFAMKKLIKSKNKDPEVVDVINNLDKEITKKQDKKIEAAYKQLTEMCTAYTKKITEISNMIKIDPDRLEQELQTTPPLLAMQYLGKLHKESREMVKDLSALRAPKAIVAQYLETSIDNVIRSTSEVLHDSMLEIKDEVFRLFDNMNLDVEVDGSIFSEVFKNVVSRFKDSMISLKRDQMAKAMQALTDMEKII